MKQKIRQDERFGPWRIAENRPLGTGGNSEVWRAESDDGTQVALKFLNPGSFKTSRYQRFVQEVRFLQHLGSRPGILPLVDSHLPATPTKEDRPWLATPLAMPLAKALAESEPGVGTVVASVRQIAEALKGLHAEGAAHRDIKPDNLFLFNGRAVLGDFGLVDYPDRQPITTPSERIGPLFFIAPEMLNNTGGIDPKPADVYSLAKSLWALAAGQNYPFPGELRTDTPQLRLSSYVRHDRVAILDLLLERCTRHDPKDRPTMDEFAAELSAWSIPAQSDQIPDLMNLSARFQPLVSQAKSARKAYDSGRKRAEELNHRLNGFLIELEPTVAKITGFRTRVLGNTNIMLKFFPYPSGENSIGMWKQNCSLECLADTTTPGVHIVLFCGFVFDVSPDGRAQLTGGYVIAMNDRKPVFVANEVASFLVGSACEDHVITDTFNRLRRALSEAVGHFADVIADPSKLELRGA